MDRPGRTSDKRKQIGQMEQVGFLMKILARQCSTTSPEVVLILAIIREALADLRHMNSRNPEKRRAANDAHQFFFSDGSLNELAGLVGLDAEWTRGQVKSWLPTLCRSGRRRAV